MTGSIILFGILFILSNNKLDELPLHIEKQYTEISKARADEVSKELKGLSQSIEMISRVPIIRTMNLEKIQEFLPEIVLHENYRNMTIAYPNGNGWSTYPDDLSIKHEEQYLEIFKKGKDAHISQPFRSKYIDEKDKIIITVSESVKNNIGETIGLVNGVVKIEFLNEIVKSMDLKDRGYSWIVNKDGFLVAHSKFKDVYGKNIKDTNLEKNKNIATILQRKVHTTEYINKQGNEMIAFSSPIENSPEWIFVISMYKDNLFADINSIKATILGALGLGILLVIAFSFYYSNKLTKPILNLKETFEDAENGNLNVRADESTPNELGDAAKSFNRMLNQIKELTYNDLVTGMYNYNGFLMETKYILNQLKDKDSVGVIVIISIDDFKSINSLYGFALGDETLLEFAKKLKTFVKDEEVLSRFLGDEFIMFLKEDNQDLFEKRMDKLRKLCNGEINLIEARFILKTSIGISFKETNDIDIDKLIHEATVAKLRVKKKGGNDIAFYDCKLEEDIRREQKIEDSLYDAIKNNELKLMYQPIISSYTGQVVLMEALLRWNSPIHGNISPIKIIEIAERNGFIIDIGNWVLRQACRTNKGLQDKGFKAIKVAVNVSALQFEQIDFPMIVERILNETGLEGKYLELEITETNIMDRVESKIETMKILKKIGISISIDDFGTGYSSLSYFTRFPIDILKIDKSFIQNMLKDENSKTIVATIISMAKALNLRIIAEGVETIEQFNYLQEQGCHKIQGYLISKPTVIEEIEEILKSRNS